MMRLIKAVMVLTLAFSVGKAMGVENPDSAHTTVMPAVDISNQPLEKVLEQLRVKLPWFHYVVFRSPGAPVDYPKLPTLSVDGVTVQQFLDLLKDQYPAVKINVIPGDKSPLYSVQIDDPQTLHPQLPDGPSSAGNLAVAENIVKIDYAKTDLASKEVELHRVKELFEKHEASQHEMEQAELAVRLAQAQVKLAMLEHDQAMADAAKAQVKTGTGTTAIDKLIVKVYRLNDLIKGGDTKTAMNDVLSVIQATFDAAGGDAKDKPVLSVHAQTETLIFKGSPEKMQLLEQVLETLRPRQASESEKVQELQHKLDVITMTTDRLQGDNLELREELRSSRRFELELNSTRAELEQVREQLAAARKAATQPSK